MVNKVFFFYAMGNKKITLGGHAQGMSLRW